jgi:hypothetical protein
MTKKTTTHGGRREGAGRPKGRKTKNPKGKVAVSRTVSMHPHSWDRLDRLRGDTPRGKFIESKLGLPPPEHPAGQRGRRATKS